MKRFFLALFLLTVIIGCTKDDNPAAPTTGTISGRITDSANSNPVAGASVTTQPVTSSTTTDAQGNYTLTNVAPATYTVSAAKTGYTTNTAQIAVTAGNTATANIALTAAHQAGDVREFPLGNTGINIAMAWVPSGRFNMGSPSNEQDRQASEGPVHQVTFDQGFWVSQYEVTQGQWQAAMGINPSSGYGVGANYPVYNLSWDNIQGFITTIGGTFRLPSEAEWEYACRAGTTTRFYWGDDPNYSGMGTYAWYSGNSSASTHPVGGKQANAWGLFDMPGNVWEWCQDWYHDDYTNAPANGSAWMTPSGTARVNRGGSFANLQPMGCRSAIRNYAGPATSDRAYGLRLVRAGD